MKIPENSEYELAYLGTIYRWDGIVYPIPADAFYNPKHKAAYEQLKRLGVEPLDTLQIKECIASVGYTNKDIIKAIELVDEWVVSAQEKYGKSLKKLLAKRKAIVITDKLNKAVSTSENIWEDISGAINELMDLSGDCVSNDTAKYVSDFHEEYYNNLSQGNLGYKSGIKLIDELCWGIQPWTVTRLNAYSNIGKTRLAIHIMGNLLKQWIECVFYSTEVTSAHFFPIYVSSVQGLSFKEVKSGSANIDWDSLDKLPLTFFQDKFKLDEIIASARKIMPKVIFIDFAQNIDCGFISEEYKNMSLYAREIQKFAITNNIAVFDLSQISNEGAKLGASSNIIASKGSGSLVSSADVGLMIERKEFSSQATILELSVKKNKYWPLGVCELAVGYEKSTYEEFIIKD